MKYRVVVEGKRVLDNKGKGYDRADAILMANEIRRYDNVSAIAEQIPQK